MSKKQKRVFWPTLALIVLTLTGIVFLSARDNRATQQPNSPRERIEAEPVTLWPRGFEPSAFTRPRGRFLLAVDNRSGFPDLDFRLVRLNGNQEAAKKMRGRELRWRQLVDLPPGDYVLTEANHPRWRCQISITPH